MNIITFLFVLMLQQPAQCIEWESDYAQAFRTARERDVPVFIALNMDGEQASDWTANSLYRDPEFVRRSRDFVCLVGSVYTHSPEVCSRFGSVTCREHQKVEMEARRQFLGGAEWAISPQHFLVSPEGDVLRRRAYQASKAELFEMMRFAERKMGDALLEEDSQLSRIQDLKKRAQNKNMEISIFAINELGGMPRLEARDVLIGLLGSSSDATRMAALAALSHQKGSYDVLPHMLKMLKDPNSEVVRYAIVSLEKLGLPEAVPELLTLWKRKPMVAVAREIPRALAKLAPADPKVRDLVCRVAGSSDTLVELSAIVALADLEDGEKAVKLLLKKLRAKTSNARGAAVWSLGKRKAADARPRLESMLEKESDPNVIRCIEAALRAIDSGDGQELETLIWRFVRDDIRR